MKLAIVHNALDTIGGAEKITLTLAKALHADIYTTNIEKKNIKAMGFDIKNIFSIGTIPQEQPYKHTLAFWKFSTWKAKGYDKILICGDWAVGAANKNNNCVWYCHAPARELFDLYEYTKKNNLTFWQKPVFYLWVKYHKKRFIKYAKQCEKVLCNSNNTKQRLKKYLNIDAHIIHPGIDTKKYKHHPAKNYWLSVNRLITHKQIQLQLEIFEHLPKEQLVIVGCTEHARHFRKYEQSLNIPKNVKILKDVDEKKLIQLYSECKALIATSKDEDFGLAPLEAMASGKPVIATDEGGYKETIIHKKTGFLVKNKKEFMTYMDNIADIKKEDCIKQAKKFDLSIFFKKMKKSLQKK